MKTQQFLSILQCLSLGAALQVLTAMPGFGMGIGNPKPAPSIAVIPKTLWSSVQSNHIILLLSLWGDSSVTWT